jgi:RNA polymerase sigma factor (sigma-70 family)
MTDTPHSLLMRLRFKADDNSWKRLIDLYTPLLQRWLRQAGVAEADAADLLQETFLAVVREMPSFEHNQQRGAYRCWLRAILVNRLRGHWNARRTALPVAASAEFSRNIERLEDPADDLNQIWDREHDAFLANRILQLIEKDFTASTWHAFRRVVMDGARPAEIAVEMGLSVNAVLLAKSRVLRRARQEIDGLID